MEQAKISSVDKYILLEENEFLIYRDKFGRKWKLEQIRSEHIQFPFKVTPIPNTKATGTTDI